MQRFGEKLRTLRKIKHMTQRQLADDLGFAAHSHINALETGRKKPSAELVFKIARLFSVTADELLDDAVDINSN